MIEDMALISDDYKKLSGVRDDEVMGSEARRRDKHEAVKKALREIAERFDLHVLAAAYTIRGPRATDHETGTVVRGCDGCVTDVTELLVKDVLEMKQRSRVEAARPKRRH